MPNTKKPIGDSGRSKRSADQLEDVHLQRCVVVDLGAVEVDKKEDVVPHVVLQPYVVLKTLRTKRS